MLTEKDYCDYETCVALMELGFTLDMTEKKYERNLVCCRYEDVPKPTLYEAQKFLREEKDIQVSILPFEDYDTDADGNKVGRWVSYAFDLQWTTSAEWINYEGHTYDFDTMVAVDTYEEALSEGIKAAVKLLKGELYERD